jgi:hypothetical protein
MALAADAHPEAYASRVSQSPEHGDLMVAEQNQRVASIARVPQGADAEWPVVDKVAKEDGAPLVRWIRLQRLEESLEIAVDVPDDQNGQVVRHSFDAYGRRK